MSRLKVGTVRIAAIAGMPSRQIAAASVKSVKRRFVASARQSAVVAKPRCVLNVFPIVLIVMMPTVAAASNAALTVGLIRALNVSITTKGAQTVSKKKTCPTNWHVPKPKRPVLRFTPTAWAKLIYLRDAGGTEIGGFGIAAADDLLRVENVALVRQTCNAVHVEFDDESVADLFDALVDEGRRPEEFGRIWIHTHPASSADPSRTDEVTFDRAFGQAHWAVMFILARGGQTYARLRYNLGPGAEVSLPVEVDYSRPFAGCDRPVWQAEYDRCVRTKLPVPAKISNPRRLPPPDDGLGSDWYETWEHYVDESLDPTLETFYEYDREL